MLAYPPDLKNGSFLQVEKSLLRALNKHDGLTKHQLKIAIAIIDKTYGWGKIKDDIAISQVSQMTGIQENHCSSNIKKMVLMQIIIKEQGKYASCLGINKFFRNWEGWNTDWEWWNKEDDEEQKPEKQPKQDQQLVLTPEQLSCWEWAKTDNFWREKVSIQPEFLKHYNSPKQTLKTQHEVFMSKSAQRMTKLEEKNNRGKTIKRKSFLNMGQSNEKIIEGEVVND